MQVCPVERPGGEGPAPSLMLSIKWNGGAVHASYHPHAEKVD